MPARYTQSQKEIFKLYRRGLRALRQKPEVRLESWSTPYVCISYKPMTDRMGADIMG